MGGMQPQGWWAHPARAIVAVEADRDQERDGRDGEHAHDRPPPLDFPACVRDALSATLYFARARALLTISAWASPCWRCPEGHPPGRASRPSQCHRRRRAAAACALGSRERRVGGLVHAKSSGNISRHNRCSICSRVFLSATHFAAKYTRLCILDWTLLLLIFCVCAKVVY